MDPTDLHAYVDGELTSEQSASVDQLVRDSRECSREVDAIRNLKSFVAAKAEPADAQKAWKACVKRLDEIDKTKRAEFVVGRFAPFLCAGLFAFILIVGRVTHPSDRGNLSGPDFAKMIGGLSPSRPPKSADTDRWLRERIRESMTSTPDHLSPRRVRTGHIDGFPVTDFSARDQYGNLEIYVIGQPVVLQGTQPMDGHPDLMIGAFNGINCIVRLEGSKTILILADRSPDDLAQVAAEVTVK